MVVFEVLGGILVIAAMLAFCAVAAMAILMLGLFVGGIAAILFGLQLLFSGKLAGALLLVLGAILLSVVNGLGNASGGGGGGDKKK